MILLSKGIAAALMVAGAHGVKPQSTTEGAPAPQNPNSFNPQISLVSDFRGRLSDNNPSERKRFQLKELELAFASDVDPFLRAEAYISFGADEEDKPVAEVEEAFARYANLGRGLSAKFGKIAAAIGRVQRNHVDALNFLDYPLVVSDFLGEEGLRGGGGSLSYLFPGDRFNELTFEGVDPEDAPLFSGSKSSSPIWVGHYRTYFDFNEDTSAQLGATFANGPGAGGKRANLFGADFVYKWMPGNHHRSLVFESEAYWGNPGGAGSKTAFGAFAAATYQLRPNLFGYAKFDYSELPGTTNKQKGYSVGLTLKPTEFHHWRLEFQHLNSNFAPNRNQLNIQFQWAIGAHPAHKY